MINPPADAPADQHPPMGEVALAPERLAHSNNLLQLIQMRWLAVAGQLFTILIDRKSVV